LIRAGLKLLLFAVLTLATQLGGIAYILSDPSVVRVSWLTRILPRIAAFVAVYAVLSGLALWLAPAFGRVPLPCFAAEDATYRMHSPLYCALNRQYVTPTTQDMLASLANAVAAIEPGTRTTVLDAGFPFFDGFPLLPHLSHSDGRKVDIAYYYKDTAGRYRPYATRSPLGYWAFEEARDWENQPCSDRADWLTMRWDMDWFQSFVARDLVLDEDRTRLALQWLADEGPSHDVEKVLVEPHIADRLRVAGAIIRFQGCRAARHDDHIHIQTK